MCRKHDNVCLNATRASLSCVGLVPDGSVVATAEDTGGTWSHAGGAGIEMYLTLTDRITRERQREARRGIGKREERDREIEHYWCLSRSQKLQVHDRASWKLDFACNG